MNHALTTLNLSPAVKVQTLKLLARISQAASADELWRTSDRAAGFVLGLETAGALNSENIDGLYCLFDEATTLRQREGNSD